MTVRFGPFTLDSAGRRLLRGREPVHLTPKAFELIHLLVTEAPRVVSKRELHDRLWPGSFVSDATLVGLVKEARRAFDDRDPEAPVIPTSHRVGYAFCLEVAEVSAAPSPRAWHWLLLRDRRVVLRQGENLVGRDPALQMFLDAVGVSRRHASIVLDEPGVQLEDLGSKNGTSVNGASIERPSRCATAIGSHLARSLASIGRRARVCRLKRTATTRKHRPPAPVVDCAA